MGKTYRHYKSELLQDKDMDKAGWHCHCQRCQDDKRHKHQTHEPVHIEEYDSVIYFNPNQRTKRYK